MTAARPVSRLARRRERGAVLIVALLLMAVIALGLTSYLNLNLGTSRLAKRGHQQAASFNLAEAGLEEAIWSFNRANAGYADAWSGWTIAGSAARQSFPGFDLGGGTTGGVKVHVDSYNPGATARPTLVALASVETPGGAPVTKMVQVTLRRRSRFTAGLTAKDSVTFSGTNTSVDSWNSDPDNDPSTAPVDYSEATRNDRGSVASVKVDNTAVLINQADIWGYVYTGGGAPQVGTQGSITGRNTPAGVQIDASRVATDFNASFPAVTAPIDGTPILAVGATLGIIGQTTKWRTAGLSLSGNDTLTIYGDVILVLTTSPGSKAIEVKGNASIIIPDGSSLTVYAGGDVLIGGNGVANRNIRPSTLQIYGTCATGTQTIHIAGNGALRSVAYAPNADISINGNGDVMGGFVGNTVKLTGNAAFHYDESLENLDAGMPFGIDSWRELTTESARAAQSHKFAGW